MLYAVQNEETIIVTAASTLIEFEEFKTRQHQEEGITFEIADILEMMTNPSLKGYRAAPLIITCPDRDAANTFIRDNMIQVQPYRDSLEMHENMLEHARLEEELGKPTDRRTLAEIHGLEENDPWAENLSEQSKEALRKQDEHMKKVRESGGLTGDSFGGNLGEGINVHSGSVTVDDEGNVTGANILATKSTLTAYELTVSEETDLDVMFNTLRIPENRIEEKEGARAVIRLHDFQIKQIATVFESHRINYTLTRVVEAGEEKQSLVEGYDELYLFFSVQVSNAVLTQMIPIIDDAGIDTNTILAMHDFDDACWFICANEAHAQNIGDALDAAGHPNSIVAVNRQGKAILGEGANARVVDTNEHVVTDPRPWNDRASEIDQMSDEDREALFKGIKASEFIFVIRSHPKYRTLVEITPETYFREHGVMWSGDMPFERLVPKDFLTHVEGNTYAIGFDVDIAKANMCRYGFIESLLLQIHINELISEEMAARAI